MIITMMRATTTWGRDVWINIEHITTVTDQGDDGLHVRLLNGEIVTLPLSPDEFLNKMLEILQ